MVVEINPWPFVSTPVLTATTLREDRICNRNTFSLFPWGKLTRVTYPSLVVETPFFF